MREKRKRGVWKEEGKSSTEKGSEKNWEGKLAANTGRYLPPSLDPLQF